MTNLLGQITIVRSSDDMIRIYIEDCASGCRAIEVSIEFEAFARAVTGMGFVSCMIEQFNVSSNVGLTREVKQENIHPPPYTLEQTDADFAKVIAPFEVDGWVGDISTLRNHHNSQEDGSRRVTFRRWLSLSKKRND